MVAGSPAATEAHGPLLQFEGVSKRYGNHWALRAATLSIDCGEFVGLVGPNGAGKSTMLKILDGVIAPDEGRVLYTGKPMDGSTRGKVGVVHQDLGLIESMTVAENLVLGGSPTRSRFGPFLDLSREQDLADEALVSVNLDPAIARRPVAELTLGEQTLVAVARVLVRGAEIVVMDEATSSLSPAESRWLIQTLRERARLGAAVVMVSHKLSEITDSVDRAVVVVDGRIAADVRTSEVTPDQLVALMTKEPSELLRPGGRGAAGSAGEPVLELRAACTRRAGPFDLTVHAGEIVGVTGLIGSGLYDLALLASRQAKARSGSVTLVGGATVGYLPPDRLREANFTSDTVERNLTIASLRRWEGPLGVLRLHRMASDAERMHRSLRVTPSRLDALQSSLSGGNQQKVLMGRLLLRAPNLLVLTEPTRGVDITTRAEIYRLIREQREAGVGILVVSSDVGDLIELADRVGVVEDGALHTVRRADELSETELARLV